MCGLPRLLAVASGAGDMVQKHVHRLVFFGRSHRVELPSLVYLLEAPEAVYRSSWLIFDLQQQQHLRDSHEQFLPVCVLSARGVRCYLRAVLICAALIDASVAEYLLRA